MQGTQKHHAKAFKRRGKQLENHESLSNVLEKHPKKSKKLMCLKNENS
jgi:hypothetical protein